MNKLRILIVEDTPSSSDMLLKRLDDLSKYKVELRSEPDGAIRLVKSDEFDLVFVDLNLAGNQASDPLFEGINVAESVRSALPKAVLVLYSGWITRDSPFEHYDRCVGVGADEILPRTELLAFTAKELNEKIGKWIADKKRASKSLDGCAFTFGGSMRTAAAKEAFGVSTLEELSKTVALDMKYFHIEAIQAGYSGAAILRIKASESSDFRGGVRLILKIATSEFMLEDELRRRPRVGSHYDSSAVVPYGKEIIRRNGVSAVVVREIKNRTLLRDFFLKSGSQADTTLMKRVVSDLLVSPAAEARPWKDFQLADDAYRLKDSAICEIADTLAELAKCKAFITAHHQRAISDTSRVLNKISSGHWGFTLNDRHAARLHGDFHCRNIFIARGEAPILIDFGRSDVYPRLFDFAAFDVDLVISLLDSGHGYDHEVRSVEKWVKCVTRAFPYTMKNPKGKTNTGNRWEFIRHYTLEQMQLKLESVSPQEYGEVLMFHLLRYLRFPSVPVAKKLLAIRLIQELSQRLLVL